MFVELIAIPLMGKVVPEVVDWLKRKVAGDSGHKDDRQLLEEIHAEALAQRRAAVNDEIARAYVIRGGLDEKGRRTPSWERWQQSKRDEDVGFRVARDSAI